MMGRITTPPSSAHVSGVISFGGSRKHAAVIHTYVPPPPLASIAQQHANVHQLWGTTCENVAQTIVHRMRRFAKTSQKAARAVVHAHTPTAQGNAPLFFASITSSVAANNPIAGDLAVTTTMKKKGRASGITPASEIKTQFEHFDANGDGTLDFEEVQKACARLRLPSSDEYVAELFEEADDDKDGKINFGEFKKYVHKREKLMSAAFNKIDVDADGTLTLKEALKAVKNIGLPANEADARHMIEILDRNNDGEVTYEEFRDYLCLLPRAQLRSNATWNWLSISSDKVCSAPRSQPFKSLVCGGFAGMCSRIISAPLERARLIIQSRPAGTTSIGGALVSIVNTEGPAGLFRGCGVACMKVVPSTALQFAIFENTKDFFVLRRQEKHMTADLSVPERLLAGGLAGVVATAICAPLDTVRTQMSVPGSGLKPGAGVVDAFKYVNKTFGWRGFYKGLGPTLGSDLVGNAIGFFLYDTFSDMFRNATGRKPSPSEKGLLGGMSACVCMTLTMPLEICMTRMRIQGCGDNPILYKNTVDCLQQIVRKEGAKALFSGAGASYLKVYPQIACVYAVYEVLARVMAIKGLNAYA